MKKYAIKAHYKNNVTAKIGLVKANTKEDALNIAEDMGILDDPEADTYTALEMVSEVQESKPNLLLE